MGEAKRRLLAGDAPERARTTIALHFGGATLRAEVDPAGVDRMLDEVDGWSEAAGGRQAAKDWVVGVLGRNGHLKGEGHKVATTVLWLMCRSPELGPVARTLAREGGGILAYDITPTGAASFNWRAHIGGLEATAGMLPWLPARDFATAGSA
jgi:hypothetical protein